MSQLSKNFTLNDMTFSLTAVNKKIDNTPSPEIVDNIKKLVINTLQPIRDLYEKPVFISSGYRCPALNVAVGGAKTSQHLEGKAADISTESLELNKKLFNLIRDSKIPFDQLLDEYNFKWIHISYNEGNNRRQVLHIN